VFDADHGPSGRAGLITPSRATACRAGCLAAAKAVGLVSAPFSDRGCVSRDDTADRLFGVSAIRQRSFVRDAISAEQVIGKIGSRMNFAALDCLGVSFNNGQIV
jgi:hypothetical protein